MTIQIHDVKQNTPEWMALRCGLPTASQFSAILSAWNGKATIPVRTKYLYNLAFERISGEPLPSYSNAAMTRGHEQEPHARAMFEFMADVEVKQIGFVTNDALIKGRVIGSSPDGFVGDDEMIEIKTTEAHLLIHRIMGNDTTSEHMAQCQGGLWVCEKTACHLVTYTGPKFPLIRRKITRDDQYIKRLELAVSVFCEELDEVVDQIKRYGQ